MKSFYSEHRGFWSKEHKRSFYLAVLLIILSLIIQVGAGRYSARVAAHAPFVGDLFLDNLPVVNLDFIIVQGALIFWILSSLLLSTKPRRLLFGMKAIALFIVFRAFFISLTHIGIYPEEVIHDANDIGFGLYKLVTFQGNFFFSGHTGFPFLMMMIFWNDKFWRRIFLSATLILAASVLLTHVHYSIDVFAAPFITYGIFKITARLFQQDYLLLDSRIGHVDKVSDNGIIYSNG
ncbi:MAG: hypothetical protein KGJ89_04005 [Patescibacteria group bacterium]|nr:hypothetical protein [Patescibacteria group bacterium]MDE2015289.1 hypothetical protein [Patescibacteria group bacterium]MDE2227095.1 hypothetical protein [Patescibacteria group bacterium]